MFKRKKIWFNLHLLFSCIFALPILVLCITGSMLSYQSEIYNYFEEKNLQVIAQDKDVLGIEELLLEFGEQKPNYDLAWMKISATKGVPVIIDIKDDKSYWGYFVNPYTGEIITKNYAEYFIGIAKKLHIFFGLKWDSPWKPYGSQIVGVSTFVFLFIIISGVYLYFPFIRRKFVNSFKINLKSKGYKLFYNLHSALGLWLSIFFILMSLTGVYIAYSWVRNYIVYPVVGFEKDKTEVETSRFFDVKTLKLTKTTSKAKIKEIGDAFVVAKKAINDDYSEMTLGLSLMHENNKFYEFRYYSRDETNKVWQNSKPIAINMKRKRVMQTQENSVIDDSVFDKWKLRRIVSQLHYGSFFGPIGTFIYFISCLLFLVFPITGFLMTYRRLKRKKAS